MILISQIMKNSFKNNDFQWLRFLRTIVQAANKLNLFYHNSSKI